MILGQDIYAPPDVVECATHVLDGIDLDAASDRSGRSLVPAGAILTAAEDGLTQPWHGRVWLFPPQDSRLAAWSAKLAHEHRCGRVSAGLLYAGLDPRAPGFQTLAQSAAALCFVAGALRATLTDGRPLPRSRIAGLLAYFGPDRERFRQAASALGAVLFPPESKP